MRIEQNMPMIEFNQVRGGQVFCYNGNYYLKLDEKVSFFDNEDNQVYVKAAAVHLAHGAVVNFDDIAEYMEVGIPEAKLVIG